MRVCFIVLMLSVATDLFSQNIAGIWRGHFTSSDKISEIYDLQERYQLELQVDQKGKQLDGITYSYLSQVFYGKAVATGTINPATSKVRFEELKTIEVKMGESSYTCIMTYYLQYTRNGEEEFLEGKYMGHRESDSSLCGRGTVFLRKVATTDFKKEPFIVRQEAEAARKKRIASLTPKKKETLAPVKKPLIAEKAPAKKPELSAQPKAKTPVPEAVLKPSVSTSENKKPIVTSPVIKAPAPEFGGRKNEIAKTIVVNSPEIIINIYDNGTIDHDTVSVYLDKKLVISKKMLSTTPITLKLEMNENNSYHEVLMVAENMGDIPPNTSLMVIKSGGKEYEVRITSTDQKNAVIVFKYE